MPNSSGATGGRVNREEAAVDTSQTVAVQRVVWSAMTGLPASKVAATGAGRDGL